jgi:hypothetical protein
MTDQNVSVQPGKMAVLSVSMADGATVQNLSSAGAVWLSASPGVQPGAGTRLGALGSVQWSAAGSPCYAVTDTGVATAIPLSISSDVSTPVNPVDIGVAVALQLNAQGIPISNPGDIGTSIAQQSLTVGNALSLAAATNTAIATAIAAKQLQLTAATSTAIGAAVAAQNLTIGSITGGNVSISNTSIVGNDVAVAINNKGVPGLATGASLGNGSIPTNLDVSQYSTVNVQLTVLTAGYINIWCKDPVNLYQYNLKQVNVVPGSFIFSYPVTASNLSMSLGGGATGKNYNIYGTNIVTTDFQVHGCDTNVNYNTTQTWGNNQNFTLGTITSRGGLYQVRALATGGGKGYFGYYDYTNTGVQNIARIIATTNGATGPTGAVEFYGQVALPPGSLYMVFNAQYAASYQVIWELTALNI